MPRRDNKKVRTGKGQERRNGRRNGNLFPLNKILIAEKVFRYTSRVVRQCNGARTEILQQKAKLTEENVNVSKRLRSYIDQLYNMSQNENQLLMKCEYAYMHEFIIKPTVYTDVIRLNLV